MPLPRVIARFNRRVTNRLLIHLALRAPFFGVVEHMGRRSGKVYRTPVNVFPRSRGYVIALTYGPRSDWVRNVLAAGGCRLETRGRHLRLSQPRLIHDDQRRAMPLALRPIGALGQVSDFLDLTVADANEAEQNAYSRS
jgi:deazaflavin-dependent oxidoreductase (nitroreductase family)